jgi:hypothetical protein
MTDLSFLKFWDKAKHGLEPVTNTLVFKQLNDATRKFLHENQIPEDRVDTFIVSGNEYLLGTDFKNAKLLLQLLNQTRNKNVKAFDDNTILIKAYQIVSNIPVGEASLLIGKFYDVLAQHFKITHAQIAAKQQELTATNNFPISEADAKNTLVIERIEQIQKQIDNEEGRERTPGYGAGPGGPG